MHELESEQRARILLFCGARAAENSSQQFPDLEHLITERNIENDPLQDSVAYSVKVHRSLRKNAFVIVIFLLYNKYSMSAPGRSGEVDREKSVKQQKS